MAGAIMDKVWGLFGGVGQEAEDFENDEAYDYEENENYDVELKISDVRCGFSEKNAQCIKDRWACGQ